MPNKFRKRIWIKRGTDIQHVSLSSTRTVSFTSIHILSLNEFYTAYRRLLARVSDCGERSSTGGGGNGAARGSAHVHPQRRSLACGVRRVRQECSRRAEWTKRGTAGGRTRAGACWHAAAIRLRLRLSHRLRFREALGPGRRLGALELWCRREEWPSQPTACQIISAEIHVDKLQNISIRQINYIIPIIYLWPNLFAGIFLMHSGLKLQFIVHY